MLDAISQKQQAQSSHLHYKKRWLQWCLGRTQRSQNDMAEKKQVKINTNVCSDRRKRCCQSTTKCFSGIHLQTQLNRKASISILLLLFKFFFNITSFLLLRCCTFLLINTGPFIFSIESAEPHIPGPIFIQLLQLKNALKCQCRSKNFICWGEE